MKVCEKYDIDTNKWSGLPPLNTARYLPGSVLLKSRRAFCFSGVNQKDEFHNSIESYELKKEGEWKTLPINDNIPQSYSLAAAMYENKVIVFGGSPNISFSTYILTEEGELEQDLS